MSERIGIYPGSFDPVTVGHMDLIVRASVLFDRLIVGVLRNPAKHTAFSAEERVQLLQKCCSGLPNVQVCAFEGLLIDLVQREHAAAVVRGLRTAADYDTEYAMAAINHQLYPSLETVFLASRPEHLHVSSSAVRELAAFGGDLKPYVPEAVLSDIRLHYPIYQSNRQNGGRGNGKQ